MKKDPFLANQQNMQRFISMLSEELMKKNCEAHHSSGDADLHVVGETGASCNKIN